MRTGLEVTALPADVTVLEERLRKTGAALVDALSALPTPDLDPFDRTALQDLRWNITEALQMNTAIRRRLDDRLAGATPGQSHYASLHDPPDAACQPEPNPP